MSRQDIDSDLHKPTHDVFTKKSCFGFCCIFFLLKQPTLFKLYHIMEVLSTNLESVSASFVIWMLLFSLFF